MFITKEHYNALLGYRDVALKTIQEAECVNATNKQVCDFNKRLIEELRKTRTEVASEIFEEIGKILYKHTNIAIKEKSTTCELAIDYIGEDIAELKKKYTEEQT